MSLEDSLNDLSDQIATADSMVEQMMYLLFGAVVTSTRLFGKVDMKISEDAQRIFISVEPKWLLRKIDWLARFFLARAERKAMKFMPHGWRLLIYYKRSVNERGN